MALYRKRTAVIEASQFLGSHLPDPVGVWRRDGVLKGAPYVVTAQSQVICPSPGDWIVPDKDGVHFYTVSPEVFAATYEPVDGEGK